MSDEGLSRDELVEELRVLRDQVGMLEQTCAQLRNNLDSLHEQATLCKDIIDNLAVGAFISSVDGELLHANPALLELAGFDDLGEFLTTKTEQFYADTADRAVLANKLQQNGVFRKEEVQFVSKDGTHHWVSVSAKLLENVDDKLPRVVGTIENISDRKDRDQRLGESEQRFRIAFETGPDAVVIARERDGVYVDVNEGFLSMTGYTRTEVIGNSSIALNIWDNPDDRATLRRLLQRDGYVKNLELLLRTKDGRSSPCLMSARIITLQGEPHILSVTRDIGEWKKTTKMLQEAEKRFVRLLENTNTGLLVVDVAGRVISANDHYARMAGAQSANELIGRSVLEWTAPECVEENAAAVARCAGQGCVSDFETVYVRPDGSRARILVNSTREDSEEGSYLTTLCQDITERTKAEAERQQAQAMIQQQHSFLASVLEALPHPFYVIDASNHRIVLANSAAKVWGLYEGSTCHSVWHGRREPCTGLQSVCCLQEVVSTKKPVTVEHIHNDLKGNPRFVQIQAYPIVNALGEVTQVIGYAVDTTVQKKANERFQESEERFRKFAEEVSFEGIVIHRDRKILYVNPVFARMYGYERAELLGMDAMETIAEESRELASRNMREGHEEPYEAMSLKKDGTVFPVEIHAKAIPFAGGSVRAAATRDLTKARESEKALRESESRFRSLFEAAIEFIEILDENGHILEANPAFLQGTGWTHDQVIGKSVDEFLTPASKAIFAEHLPAILNEGSC